MTCSKLIPVLNVINYLDYFIHCNDWIPSDGLVRQTADHRWYSGGIQQMMAIEGWIYIFVDDVTQNKTERGSLQFNICCLPSVLVIIKMNYLAFFFVDICSSISRQLSVDLWIPAYSVPSVSISDAIIPQFTDGRKTSTYFQQSVFHEILMALKTNVLH